MSRLSLAQQLAELAEVAPAADRPVSDLDPEDVHAGAVSEDDSPIDNSAAREHYVDVAVTDPKYDGVRTTRRQLFEDVDAEAHSEPEASSPGGSLPSQSDSEGAPGSSQEEEEDDGEDEDESEPAQSDREEQPGRAHIPSDPPRASEMNRDQSIGENEEQHNGDLASALRKTREEDRQKGKAVARQIKRHPSCDQCGGICTDGNGLIGSCPNLVIPLQALWDTLLDARIQMQKVVTAANRLPSGAYLETLSSHPSARTALDGMFGEAAALADELFSLQEVLLTHNENVTPPARKRRRIDPDNSAVDALRGLSGDASALEASYHAHLVHTLTKWSAKVQAVAPGVLLAGRNAFNKDTRAAGVVPMVDEILRVDGSKLLGRTRTRRGKGVRMRAPDASEPEGDDAEDPEVFDDLDFYQQLLRDVIKTRGGDGGEQDWMAQQRERKAKRKLKVDTKASKGRKLRYEVHPKLQNFMVPVPVVHGAWHEEQIDGLFSSLLGAG
ncbi:predicted protein [Postia placenta Mad-698-R]|nr:predicted protein [Postia placenta Mad-698-R]